MADNSIYTVLEKIGRRTFWRDEEIGLLMGSLTGDRKIHVEPPCSDKKSEGPRWLVVDGRLDKDRAAARVGHHAFVCEFRRADKLPFKIEG